MSPPLPQCPRAVWATLLLVLACIPWSRALSASEQPVPLARAHSHNDYEHSRPLLDALDHGFCSVEADIYLVDGKLLVAHDRDKVRPERTLESLYLDPLRRRIQENGGRIYRGGPTFLLLIDIKSEAEPTYIALHSTLKPYAEVLTTFQTRQTETKGLLVVISGNRPAEFMAAQPLRYAALDGRLQDLNAPVSTYLTALISDNWRNLFTWRGRGNFPTEEKERLRQYVAKSHAAGCPIRFWAAPDLPSGWQELLDAGVDLINTDHLPGLEEFLKTRLK